MYGNFTMYVHYVFKVFSIFSSLHLGQTLHRAFSTITSIFGLFTPQRPWISSHTTHFYSFVYLSLPPKFYPGLALFNLSFITVSLIQDFSFKYSANLEPQFIGLGLLSQQDCCSRYASMKFFNTTFPDIDLSIIQCIWDLSLCGASRDYKKFMPGFKLSLFV